MTPEATTRETQAIVTYRPCAACGLEIPVRAQVPGGELYRARSEGEVSCSAKCRSRLCKRRRAA